MFGFCSCVGVVVGSGFAGGVVHAGRAGRCTDSMVKVGSETRACSRWVCVLPCRMIRSSLDKVTWMGDGVSTLLSTQKFPGSAVFGGRLKSRDFRLPFHSGS